MNEKQNGTKKETDPNDFKEALVLFEMAKNKLSIRDKNIDALENAIDFLSEAVKLMANAKGEMSKEIVSIYIEYGKALRLYAISLGEELFFQVNDNNKQCNDAERETIVSEVEANLELSWNVLELSRHILSTSKDKKDLKLLSDVHMLLGDIQIESEHFEEALNDLNSCLRIRIDLCSSESRELAEINYKLSICFEFLENKDAAIFHAEKALNGIKKHLLNNEQTIKKEDFAELKITCSELQEKLKELALIPKKEVSNEPVNTLSVNPLN